MKDWILPVFMGVIPFGEAFSFARSAPLNDDFENRIVLGGSAVTFTGTFQNATIQPVQNLRGRGESENSSVRKTVSSEIGTHQAQSRSSRREEAPAEQR